MTTAPVRVYVEADVKCYHCGHTSGVVRTDRGPANPRTTFLALGTSVETPIGPKQNVKCLRCGGPTYFDEFEQRHEYAPLVIDEDRPRRGRPPKRLLERQGAA